MSIYQLKPRFQAVLRPIVRTIHKAGITANQVTIVACALSVLVGACVAGYAQTRQVFLVVPVWFLVRMALNAIDGLLARECGQASRLGAYLNELTDVVSDAALYAPFALLPGSGSALIAAVILLGAISEMAGVLGIQHGVGRRYEGPMGKSDRALVFSAVAVLAGLGAPVGPALNWIWVATALLLAMTIVNRVRAGVRNPSDQPGA